MNGSSAWITEATAETFEREAIERSNSVPVVVDFWAEWCGPCRVLGPTLERLAEEYAGRFVLVKADIDALPEIAAGFGVRSIPAVFGLRDGKAVDAFVGAQPEPAVRAWLESLMPTAAESLAAESKQLETSDPAAAESKYRAALTQDPRLAAAWVGLARIALAAGNLDAARGALDELEDFGPLEGEAATLSAELALRTHAAGAGDIVAVRAGAAARPDDPEMKLKLAEALAARREYAEALALCLELVERHRKSHGDPARQTMVSIFQLLPPDSELAAEFRRKLSVALS
jgi:putative thioredoxin